MPKAAEVDGTNTSPCIKIKTLVDNILNIAEET